MGKLFQPAFTLINNVHGLHQKLWLTTYFKWKLKMQMPFLMLNWSGESRNSDVCSHLKLLTSIPRFPSSQTWVFYITDGRRLFFTPQAHFLCSKPFSALMQTLLHMIFTHFLPHFHHPLFNMVFLNLIN